MLNFIGTGSAFNTKLGNNGAYIKKDNLLFMIDCGSNTFNTILNKGLLKDIEHIYVLLTHTHADHVGSLGDLILYGYYSMGKLFEPSVTVFAPYDLKIRHLLRGMGVMEETYSLMQFNEGAQCGVHCGDLHIQCEAVKVNHVKELDCFGYIINYNGKKIYYSGDCNDIPDHILKQINDYEFNLIYQDTCKADYEGNVHLSLRKLDELIDYNVRNRVFCMHLDEGIDKNEIVGLGFNFVISNT